MDGWTTPPSDFNHLRPSQESSSFEIVRPPSPSWLVVVPSSPTNLSDNILYIFPPYIPQTLPPTTRPTYATLPVIILVNVNLLLLSFLLSSQSVNCGMVDHPYPTRAKRRFPLSVGKPQEKSITFVAAELGPHTMSVNNSHFKISKNFACWLEYSLLIFREVPKKNKAVKLLWAAVWSFFWFSAAHQLRHLILVACRFTSITLVINQRKFKNLLYDYGWWGRFENLIGKSGRVATIVECVLPCVTLLACESFDGKCGHIKGEESAP